MKLLFWSLVFCSTILHAGVDVLPNSISLKNKYQSFSSENFYAVKDGKIWVKPNHLVSGIKGEWELFDGTGIPFGHDAKSFKSNDKIKEIGQESLIVVALSEKNRFYFWSPTYKTPKPTWLEKLGTPFPDDLILPKSKAWTFSVGVAAAPEKRLTPMKDIVSFFEDGNGKKIEFGFTATIFTVDPDGQLIRYWDTGLPPSFSRGFVSPERGRFIIDKISAAGSTIFVTDKSGKMYTRMYDYEINGACPGLRFTYDKNLTKNDDTNKIYKLFDAVRTLPLEDWREQMPVQLEPGATITNDISINLTGAGNAARELRVRGTDANGSYGYYYKKVFDSKWDFRKNKDEVFAADDVIQKNQKRKLGKVVDKTYVGVLAKNLKIELNNFNYFNSDSNIRVHYGHDKFFDLIFHTVDAWNMTVQMKETPQFIGKVYGEPKLLKGTIEIPENILNSQDPEIKKIVDEHFRRFHIVPFVFEVSANDAKVKIVSRGAIRKSTDYMDLSFPQKLKLVLKNPNMKNVNEKDIYNLRLEEKDQALIMDKASIKEELKITKQRLKDLVKLHRNGKLTNLKHLLIDSASAGAWHFVNGIISFANVPDKHTLIGGLTITGGGTLSEYAELNFKMIFASNEEYKEAKDSLRERIRNLKILLKDSESFE